jgi:hypothetical protein
LDDGQAKAVAIAVMGAAAVEALERLEETADVTGWNHVAGVGHREHCLAVCGAGRDSDVPAGDVVADGIVDEVGDESFDQSRVAVERSGEDGGLDMQFEGLRVDSRVEQHGLADVRQVGSLPVVESALTAGKGEEGFDEVFLLVVGGEQFLGGVTPGVCAGVGVVEGDLEQVALRRERGA